MAKARRDNYAAVGSSLRAVVDLAATRSLKAREYRVLLAIIGATAAWSRLSERVAVQQIADATGLDRSNVRRALAALDDLGIIDYEPGSSEPGQPRRSSRVTLPDPTDRGSTDPRSPSERPGVLGHQTGGPGTPDRGSTDPRSPSERPGVLGHQTGGPGTPDRGSTSTPTGGPGTPRPGAVEHRDRGSQDPPLEKFSEELTEKFLEENREDAAAAAVCTACDGSRWIEDNTTRRWSPCPTCGPDVVLPDDPLTVKSDAAPVADLIASWQNGPPRG